MDQILLNMLAFTIDMNGITDITAHDLVNYGCWCSDRLKFFYLESYRCRIYSEFMSGVGTKRMTFADFPESKFGGIPTLCINF